MVPQRAHTSVCVTSIVTPHLPTAVFELVSDAILSLNGTDFPTSQGL